MRIIDKHRIDLHLGYKDIQFLEARLQAEWKRAIQVAQRHSGLTTARRRGQISKIARFSFLAFLVLCVLLWVGIYYLPENRAQLLVYLCVLGIAGSLSGAAYMFYRGSASVKTLPPPSMALMESWWKSLRPKRYVARTKGERAEVEFLKSLSFLDDNHVAVWGLLTSAKITSDTDVLVLGPTGIWLFEVKYWGGTISKQDGIWYVDHRNGGRKIQEKSPDGQWLEQKEEILKTIRMRLPTHAWLAELIKGGIVFAHQNAKLGQISGHQVSCGTPRAWHTRIRETKPGRDFGVEDQLQLLDALILYAHRHEKGKPEIVSARQEAKQLYENAVAVLRKYVSERLK